MRHLDRCIPEKFERARRIREQAEMFAAMGWLESTESVMGEIRAYRRRRETKTTPARPEGATWR